LDILLPEANFISKDWAYKYLLWYRIWTHWNQIVTLVCRW